MNTFNINHLIPIVRQAIFQLMVTSAKLNVSKVEELISAKLIKDPQAFLVRLSFNAKFNKANKQLNFKGFPATTLCGGIEDCTDVKDYCTPSRPLVKP